MGVGGGEGGWGVKGLKVGVIGGKRCTLPFTSAMCTHMHIDEVIPKRGKSSLSGHYFDLKFVHKHKQCGTYDDL